MVSQAKIYYEDPKKLFHEYFQYACSLKAHGKATKSVKMEKNHFLSVFIAVFGKLRWMSFFFKFNMLVGYHKFKNTFRGLFSRFNTFWSIVNCYIPKSVYQSHKRSLMTDLLWQSSHGRAPMTDLSWQTSHNRPLMTDLSWQRSHNRPLMTELLWQTSHDRPLMTDLSWLSSVDRPPWQIFYDGALMKDLSWQTSYDEALMTEF